MSDLYFCILSCCLNLETIHLDKSTLLQLLAAASQLAPRAVSPAAMSGFRQHCELGSVVMSDDWWD